MTVAADRYQALFRRVDGRLAELPVERCRELELAQTRALRVGRAGDPMLRELLAAMRDAPLDEAWRDRAHHTLRRLHVALLRSGADPSRFEVAANAFLDGQTELAAAALTAEVYLRPWGER